MFEKKSAILRYEFKNKFGHYFDRLSLVLLLSTIAGLTFALTCSTSDWTTIMVALLAGLVVALISTFATVFFRSFTGFNIVTGRPSSVRWPSVDTDRLQGGWKMRDWPLSYPQAKFDALKESLQDENRQKIMDLGLGGWDEKRKRTFQRWTETDDAFLRVKGNYIEGYFSHPDLVKMSVEDVLRENGPPTPPLDRAVYRIEGQVEGNFLFASWVQLLPRNRDVMYRGLAMFKITFKNGHLVMIGRWVGTDSSEESVGCGVWEWVKKGSNAEWPSVREGLDQ